MRRIMELSEEAIAYGVHLSQYLDETEVWKRLYRFPFYPIGALRVDLRALTDSCGESWRIHLDKTFPWLYLENNHPVQRQRSTRFKIYVSPVPRDFLPVALGVMKICSQLSCRLLKVPAAIEYVSRPDKIVIYTDSWSLTQQVAAALTDEFKAFSSHGTPFTSPWDTHGLISWACDSHLPAGTLSSGMTWRVWLSQEVAASIYRLRHQSFSVERWVDEVLLDVEQNLGISVINWNARKVGG